MLLEVVEKAPSEFGYEFGRWTAQRLSTYLQEQTGIKLSSKQITRILQKKKYVYIWAKYSLEDRQDKTERAVFREKLETYLKAGIVAPEIFPVCGDETGFSLRVIRCKVLPVEAAQQRDVRKSWTLPGRRQKVTGHRRRRGRVKVMGRLHDRDRLSFSFFVDKGNGKSFLESVEKLNKFIKAEWAGQGNNSAL